MYSITFGTFFMNSIGSRLVHVMTHAYAGISKEMWILAITMLINRSGSMVLLFMNVYLTTHLHFSIPQAGFVLSMFGAGSLAGAFVGGKIVDKIGFYPVLIWSLLLSGLLILVLGFMQHYLPVAAITFLVSASGDMFRPANSASISAYSKKENYPQSIALNRLAMNLGFTVGPMLGGLLAHTSYSLLFWVDGFTCIAAAAFLWFFLPAKSVSRDQTKEESPQSNRERSPYYDRKYLYFLFFCTLYAMSFFQFIVNFPLYFKNIYHLSEMSIGLLMALNGVGVAVIEMFLIFYLKDKWSHFNFIALGMLLLILAFLILIPFTGLLILVLCILLLTVSEMLAMPFMSTYSLNRAHGKNMGDYMALYSMSWSLALIAAPLLGSQIVNQFGFDVLWGVVAGIGLIAFAGIKMLGREM